MPRGRPRGSTAANAGNKVKQPMSPYACFVKTCREEHKKMHPEENVQFGELAAQCAQRWKTMSDKEKEKFFELAFEDKQRYADEVKTLGPGVTSTGRRRRRRNRKERDPNKPKRALSAFFYYAKDERANVRANNPDFSVGEVAKELGRKWNELTDEAKAPYEKSAEEDRARYGRDMKVYRTGEAPPKKMKMNNGDAEPTGEEDEEDFDDDEEDFDEDEARGSWAQNASVDAH